MDGLGAVGGQDPPVFTDAAGDGQTGFVPHGFSEGELRRRRQQSFIWRSTSGVSAEQLRHKPRSADLIRSIQTFKEQTKINLRF